MKLKEFKGEVDLLGLKTIERPGYLFIVTAGGVTEWLIATVSMDAPCAINTNHFGHMIDEKIVRNLFHVLVKFAQTSIEDRS